MLTPKSYLLHYLTLQFVKQVGFQNVTPYSAENLLFFVLCWFKLQKKEVNKGNEHTVCRNLEKTSYGKKSFAEEIGGTIYVTRSTVARWESGSRLPDALMITRLAKSLETDVNILISAAVESEDAPNVIMVDDRKIFLSGALPILEEMLPNAIITGFTRPSEAIEFAKTNRIALAFLDIEMGKTNGFELCRMLLEINPRTNIVYLTAYVEYSLDAWSTGASGFTLKPITAENVRAQLKNLRYPFSLGGSAE